MTARTRWTPRPAPRPLAASSRTPRPAPPPRVPAPKVRRAQREARLHPRGLGWRHRREHDVAASSRRRLADPVQVADRVRHRPDPVPVLPAIGQRGGSSVATCLAAVGGNQGSAKPWLDLGDELGEALGLQVGHSHLLGPITHTDCSGSILYGKRQGRTYARAGSVGSQTSNGGPAPEVDQSSHGLKR